MRLRFPVSYYHVNHFRPSKFSLGPPPTSLIALFVLDYLDPLIAIPNVLIYFSVLQREPIASDPMKLYSDIGKIAKSKMQTFPSMLLMFRNVILLMVASL